MASVLVQLFQATRRLLFPSSAVSVRFDVQTDVGRIRVVSGSFRLYYSVELQHHRDLPIRQVFAVMRIAQ